MHFCIGRGGWGYATCWTRSEGSKHFFPDSGVAIGPRGCHVTGKVDAETIAQNGTHRPQQQQQQHLFMRIRFDFDLVSISTASACIPLNCLRTNG